MNPEETEQHQRQMADLRQAFEQQARQLEGLRLTQVRYHERPGAWPAWRELSVVDSVDHGVELRGDDRAFFITWDNAFLEYGLGVFEGRGVDYLEVALVTNVMRDSRWSRVVGQRIAQVRVYWCSMPDDPELSPQDIELVFERGDVVLLSAAAWAEGTQALVEKTDNVLVLFGEDTIRKHGAGAYRVAAQHPKDRRSLG